jgi:hypothetical protein
MVRKALTLLRFLVGLGLMLAGGYVLFKGGLSLQGPQHVYWGCAALAVVLLLPGVFLLRPGFFLHRLRA